MSKLKKMLSMVLAMVMVLATTLTAFAAPNTESPYTSKIKVTGLSSREETTVKLYKVVSFDEANSKWVVADWATADVDTTKNPFVIDWEALNGKVGTITADYTLITGLEGKEYTTSVEQKVPVGAYLIIANGEKATYTVMGANTYDKDKTYMASKDVTVTAKTSGYVTDKEADDHFVARGQEVTFTVKTTFPTFTEAAPEGGHKYYIEDTPIGLDITELVSATVGGTDVKREVDEAKEGSTTKYTVDFSKLIGTENDNAGKEVVLVYKAIVTADDGYQNTANSYRDGHTVGKPGEEKGYTGDITITKYAENDTTVLNGAKFKVYKGTKDQHGEALKFVQKATGEYKLAETDEEGTVEEIEATNGTVKVTGLDEGKYWFEEILAPAGYSINEDGVTVEVVEDREQNVSRRGSLTDTKLSSLPSTGGIGTTIFTIGGCVVMIAAAGLFFATRKKSAK